MSSTTKAICRSHSLYEIEEALELLAEAVEQSPDDPSLPIAVGEYLEAALEKRDNVARFLCHLEQQQEFARAEIRRLKDRESRLATLQQRIEECVVRFLESKQLRKLEGKSPTLALRACPPSVVIHDPSSIPANFQTVRQEVVVDKRAIKAAIEAGQDVPGCDLLIGKQTLIRR
jgi:Siphovirus Gp157